MAHFILNNILLAFSYCKENPYFFLIIYYNIEFTEEHIYLHILRYAPNAVMFFLLYAFTYNGNKSFLHVCIWDIGVYIGHFELGIHTITQYIHTRNIQHKYIYKYSHSLSFTTYTNGVQKKIFITHIP